MQCSEEEDGRVRFLYELQGTDEGSEACGLTCLKLRHQVVLW